MKKQKIVILMALTIMTASIGFMPMKAMAEVQQNNMINYIMEDGRQYVNLNEFSNLLGIKMNTNLSNMKISVAGKILEIQDLDKYIHVNGEYLIDKSNNTNFYNNQYYSYKTIIDAQGNNSYLVPKQVIEYLGFDFGDNESGIDKNELVNQYNQLKADFFKSLIVEEVNLV